jgi:hypothetical protein
MKRTITIGLSTSRIWNPFTALIRWWWDIPYSHVYIKWSTPWGFSEVLEASGLSVRMREFDRWSERQRVIAEFEFEVERETFNQIMQELRPMTGKPYGWKQVLGLAIAELFGLSLNPFSDGDRSLICSELGIKALVILGVIDRANNIDLINPKDVHDILRRHDVIS